jgi:hypothetical protein
MPVPNVISHARVKPDEKVDEIYMALLDDL